MYLLDAFVYLGIVAAGISGALIGIKKNICLGITFSLRMVSVIYKLNFPVFASEKL
jgi:uncharacterized membrane protein YeiH